jgi:hypothetical protein
MIPVSRPDTTNEPPFFDLNCRQRGATFLTNYPDSDPHERSEYWGDFRPDIARLFEHRCGWQATGIDEGVVEHMLSCGLRKNEASPHRHLTFEWSNYRYCTGVINSRKGILDDLILDPCDVLPGWFEIELPTFLLKTTDQIPTEQLRQKACFTIKKLRLNDRDPRFTRWRWYKRFWNNGAPDLAALAIDAPLIAAAVANALSAGTPLPSPVDYEPTEPVKPRRKYRRKAI